MTTETTTATRLPTAHERLAAGPAIERAAAAIRIHISLRAAESGLNRSWFRACERRNEARSARDANPSDETNAAYHAACAKADEIADLAAAATREARRSLVDARTAGIRAGRALGLWTAYHDDARRGASLRVVSSASNTGETTAWIHYTTDEGSFVIGPNGYEARNGDS